jgi:hypothetical protein
MAPWSCPWMRFRPCRETALAPGGRQVAPLVFSAWDSATRNAATAVVNSGGSTPPAPRSRSRAVTLAGAAQAAPAALRTPPQLATSP